MARERLTSRARWGADDKTPYPGSVNQDGRAEEGRGAMTYRTFEPSAANHEGIDYGWVHENDVKRNALGMGIPDPASNTLLASAEYHQKCLKAAELAELYLGSKVSDRMVLAQARDFLQLDDESLDRSLERFNRTSSVYTAEEGKPAEKPAEEKPAEAKPAEPVVAAAKACEKCKKEKCDCAKEPKVAAEPKHDTGAEKPAVVVPPAVPAAAPVSNPAPGTQNAPVAPACDEAAPVAPMAPPADGSVSRAVAATAVDLASFSFNTELNDGDPVLASDAELDGLFGDPISDLERAAMPMMAAAPEQNVKVASEKVGVKSLGSTVAPIVASAPAAPQAEDLSSLWHDSPDVNSFFSGNQF